MLNKTNTKQGESMSKYDICKLREDTWLITENHKVCGRVNVEVCDSEKEAKEWVKNKERA